MSDDINKIIRSISKLKFMRFFLLTFFMCGVSFVSFAGFAPVLPPLFPPGLEGDNPENSGQPTCDKNGFVISNEGKDLVYIFPARASRVIELPEGIETIKSGACSDLIDRQLLYLPESLKNIEKGAFEGCRLTFMRVPSASTIESDAFYHSSIWYLDMRGADTVNIGPEFRESVFQVMMLPEDTDYMQTDIFEYSYYTPEFGGTIEGVVSAHSSIYKLFTSPQYVLRGLPQDAGPDHFTGVYHTLIPPRLEERYRKIYPRFDAIEVCERELIPVVYCKEVNEAKLKLNGQYEFNVVILSYGDAVPEGGQWRLSAGGKYGEPISPELATITEDGLVTTYDNYGSFHVQYVVTDQYGKEYIDETKCSIEKPVSDEVRDVVDFLSDSFEVYDLQGRCYGPSFDRLNPGVYIVRSGKHTQKILIR